MKIHIENINININLEEVKEESLTDLSPARSVGLGWTEGRKDLGDGWGIEFNEAPRQSVNGDHKSVNERRTRARKLYAKGKTAREIADLMQLSTTTVYSYIRDMF